MYIRILQIRTRWRILRMLEICIGLNSDTTFVCASDIAVTIKRVSDC